jgi:hypothetical protein
MRRNAGSLPTGKSVLMLRVQAKERRNAINPQDSDEGNLTSGLSYKPNRTPWLLVRKQTIRSGRLPRPAKLVQRISMAVISVLYTGAPISSN